MPKIFSSFLSGFNVNSKRKKGHHADGGIFFSDFMLISKKKNRCFVWVLQLFSAISATYQSEAPWTAAVYGFWWETKTPIFGGRKNAGIRKISVRKCRKKFRTFCTFLHLQGTLVATQLYTLLQWEISDTYTAKNYSLYQKDKHCSLLNLIQV